ncbi:MAG: hypothetical protein KZQ66_16720 [Candidatus Thiodiazotropha sp. (ex Lucinoma aequizonata)]|nr:hypothetical protein [Candidatus Thiodiazotropha sp. (ex Lucinoma aequizonata)]MCU7888481.1 hypothetical protein [Candidatus Thiodiazotropha sp. (ex Lucinoma aequizonata)]MCU7894760.1 hypothetical protein [Candidatus Thiodiazotropha sp. (ex Lucinoma aequizonata)]MCU7897203.1 hypothetical protein [Candidatus Thiodiazotropha sp. (ex Lucinoma aequizonata)]MCU7903426.1 hypothetical protein [Candidatus Thiodiazotropha sp. (ex Lucinoma aequizonata)]
MDAPLHDRVKNRDIHFVELHPDTNQAVTAAMLLADVDGILHATSHSKTHLHLSYELMKVSLEQIEIGLTSMGLHIDNRLLYRLKRALYHYTEETERVNMSCNRSDSKCTRMIFADRYQRMNHNLRDQRPEHWRKYF